MVLLSNEFDLSSSTPDSNCVTRFILKKTEKAITVKRVDKVAKPQFWKGDFRKKLKSKYMLGTNNR